MLKIIEAEQGSAEWWAARLSIPTASGFNRIITPAKGGLSTQRFAYACELIVEHTLGIPVDQLDGFKSDWMEHGTQTEDEARDAYSFLTGNEVRQVACGVRDGLVAASPDGLIEGDNPGGLELKCVKPTTHVKYLMANELPTEYKCQVHGNMMVFGRNWWDFMSYAPDFPPFIIRIERDDFTETLEKAVFQFVAEFREMLDRFNRLSNKVK